MALRHQHGLRWQSRLLASAQPSVVIGTMDINTDPDYIRVTDLEMAICSSSSLNAITALEGSLGHSVQHGPGGGTALRNQHGHRWQPRLRRAWWSLVVTWTMDINTDPSCGSTTDSDIALGSSPTTGITTAPGCSTDHSNQCGIAVSWLSDTT